MSEAPDKDQKVHDPTPKRLEDERAKGNVAMAREMRHAAMFLAARVILGGPGATT